jgi:hypothetical protein
VNIRNKVASSLVFTLSAFLVVAAMMLLSISVDTRAPAPGVGGPRDDAQFVPLQEDVIVPYVGAPHAPYNSSPPTSGAHVPQTLAPGTYDSPIPPEVQVSVLRQGHVMIQYSPAMPPSEIELLERVARMHFRSVVLAPSHDVRAGIALTAWGRLEKLDAVDVDRINQFEAAHAQ